MGTPSDGQPRGTAGPSASVPGTLTSADATVLKASIGGGAVALYAAQWLTESAGRVVRPLGGVVKPIGRSLMLPPVLPPSMTPEMVIRHLVVRGNHVLAAAEGALDVVSRELVPTATEAVLERVDVTDLVLKQVDLVRIVDAVLDRIIAASDLDAAAARLDVDAVAQRLDVDAVEARLDVNAVAAGAVHGVRVQGTDAYGQAQRVVGRVPFLRREPELEPTPKSRTTTAHAAIGPNPVPGAGFGRTGLGGHTVGRSVHMPCPAAGPVTSGLPTQRSNGEVHREHGSEAHWCVRPSTNVGQTGVNPTSTVSRVGRLADILPTRNRAMINDHGPDLRKHRSGGRI